MIPAAMRMAALAAAVSIAAASAGELRTITENVLPFNGPDRDRYATWGGNAISYDSSGRPVLGWRKGGTWMSLKYVSRPGLKPLKGARSFELVASRGCGTVRLELIRCEDGAKLRFEGGWTNGAARIETALEREKLYTFSELTFISASMAPGPVTLEKLEQKSLVSEAEALELKVDTANAYHVITGSAKPVFRLRNLAGESVRWRGRLKLRDFFGEGFDIPVDHKLAAGAVAEIRPVSAMPGKGIWRVTAEISAADGSSSASESTTFAVLDDRRPTPVLGYGNFRMGTVCHVEFISDYDRKVCCEALAAMGAKLVRCNLCMMGLVQSRGPDSFDFTLQDKMIGMFQSYGLQLDTILTWAPRWSFSEARRKLSDEVGIGAMTPEPGPFRRYCEKLAERYGTKIAYYETSNEVDCRKPEYGSIDELIAFQRAGWEGVKKACPEAKVTTPGFGALSSDHPAIRMRGCQERIASEARDAYDVHVVHGHGPFEQYVEKVEAFRRWRAEAGLSDKPWFPNETALTSCLGQDAEAAETVWKKILYSRSQGAVDYCWYNLRAKNWDDDDHEGGYGMMTADFHPRSSYCSFSALASLIGECRDTVRLGSAPRRYVVRLTPSPGNLVLAFWDESVIDRPCKIKVRTDARRVFAVDLMGNRREVKFDGGETSAELSRRPAALYFEGATTAEPDAAALTAKAPVAEKPLYVIRRGLNPKAPADMTLADYSMVHDIYEAQPAFQHRLWKGAGDLSAKVWFGRGTRGRFYIADSFELGVDVRDDVHVPAGAGRALTWGDSLAFSLAFTGQKGVWTLAVADGGGAGARCEFKRVPEGFSASEAVKAATATVMREGGVTRYRVKLPLSLLKASWQTDFCRGFRFNVLVGDNDGEGPDCWIEARRGSFRTNDPSRFPLVVYVTKKPATGK